MTQLPARSPEPEILLSSKGRGWNGLMADFVLFPQEGVQDRPGTEIHGIARFSSPA
ncbi:hypothetical protein [Manganibacter manganicus]|uniref:hypothetical protein n=1 Tax=Manganibacter manganicus TaxID=1873176 RepID=UPI001301E219|nr:hypothetical protein [Pseudaminobacter manganicus]